MDKNLNMTGQDRLDALLFDIADEEDMKVDYAAMLDTVYKKAAARKKRTAFVKYGSMAAAAAIALAVGGLWFAMNGTAANTNEAAPQAPEFMCGVDSGTADCNGLEAAFPMDAPEPDATDAPAEGAGDMNDTAAGDEELRSTVMAPGLADECGLRWIAKDITLPDINFGAYYDVTKDYADGFECIVYGCTQADAEGYMAKIAAMYGAKAEDGGMSITIDGGITVTLALERDVLNISARLNKNNAKETPYRVSFLLTKAGRKLRLSIYYRMACRGPVSKEEKYRGSKEKVLYHNTDLLSQREAAYRSCVLHRGDGRYRAV